MPTQNKDHPNLWVFEHPVIQDKLTRIRNHNSTHSEFRGLLNEIAGLMFFQISRHFNTTEVSVQTPVEICSGQILANPITLVPILRAGVGMTDGILEMIPEARVGHIGVYRDEETKQPVPYYCKLPADISDGPVLLIDPMLATGGSASYAAKILSHEHGCKDLQVVCLVAAPEGVARMKKDHPSLSIFTASLDRCLNDDGYILPGLGDAGDRIFGTL
ncbi:MAG: uracil phosphoribosyltransferase [Phycisphaerales bacterium]|jgi:uracil phosphoribosyltransferase|nr:uracil phosphoribosyltransferase [Phycisphaerales bacterium]